MRVHVQRTCTTKQLCAPLTTTLGHPKSMQCNFNSCSFNYKSDYSKLLLLHTVWWCKGEDIMNLIFYVIFRNIPSPRQGRADDQTQKAHEACEMLTAVQRDVEQLKEQL